MCRRIVQIMILLWFLPIYLFLLQIIVSNYHYKFFETRSRRDTTLCEVSLLSLFYSTPWEPYDETFRGKNWWWNNVRRMIKRQIKFSCYDDRYQQNCPLDRKYIWTAPENWGRFPLNERFLKIKDFKSIKYNYITYYIVMTLVGYLYF